MFYEQTCCCIKCCTIIKTFVRRTVPGVLQTGNRERQSRTAYAFFDAVCAGADLPRAACLRVFVQSARICGPCVTVCIYPVLPCGAPLPVRERAVFEVGRGFCGWVSADVLPLLCAVSYELGDAPLGLALTVEEPACITFSTAPKLRPRLTLCKTEDGDCPPCPPNRGGIRVESQTWDVDFITVDSSVQRCVDCMKQGTFFVSNLGGNGFMAAVETSFDGEHWVQDTQKNVPAGDTLAVVAKYFGRYYRVTLSADGAGKAHVAFIGQYYAF